jgi:hypothetical protein
VTSEGGGFPRRDPEEGRREDEVVGTKLMVAIAFAISIACSSFNVRPGDRLGLSGGVFDAGRDIGGWYWTISVGAIVNVEMIDASMSVMARCI